MPSKATHPGAFRGVNWLIKHRYGPNVYAFRNLESGQVLYTQTPFPQQFNRDEQFQYSNLENRLPKLRRDLWRAMAVVELPTHEKSIDFYRDLVDLRMMRDREMKTQANLWRKKDQNTGRVWSWGHFRPTYTQEAIADLLSASEASGVDVKLYWEDAWRRGDDKHWQNVNVTHEVMPPCRPEQQFVFLRKVATGSFGRAIAAREDGSAEQINASTMPDEQSSSISSVDAAETPKPASKSSDISVSSPDLAKAPELLAFRQAQVAQAKAALEKAQESLDRAQKSGSATLKKASRSDVKAKTKALRRAERQLQIDKN